MEQILVFLRGDLNDRNKNKNFLELSLENVSESMQKIREASVVMFVDKDMSTKILKNRYGSPGIVISERQFEDYQRLLKKESEENLQKLRDEYNKLNNTPKKKYFLGSFFNNSLWSFNRS